MGGGAAVSSSEDELNLEYDFIHGLLPKNESLPRRFSDYKSQQQKKRDGVYEEMLQSYDERLVCTEKLQEAKTRILSYIPGAWIEKGSGMGISDYDVPRTTSLILVGPKGSGKSSLINRISKVFEDDDYASERAQVTYGSYMEEGTHFLQEYMIPRGSTSFCLYDTRGLSDTFDNSKMLNRWMTGGVRHGELVISYPDNWSLWSKMKLEARKNWYCSSRTRMVNFVIFVVDGVSVLNAMETNYEAHNKYNQLIATTFNCPALSFKDDKPVVVIRRGDLLSLSNRVRIRLHLGELCGIPTKQIFDIPESSDPVTEKAIVDMIRYSLEHADRHIPPTGVLKSTIRKMLQPRYMWNLICLAMTIVAAIIIVHVQSHVHPQPAAEVVNMHHVHPQTGMLPIHLGYRHHEQKDKFHSKHRRQRAAHVHWHRIRHLWFGN